MRKIYISILLIAIFYSLTADKNILEVDGEKIFFSIYDHLNSEYMIEGNSVYSNYLEEKEKVTDADYYDEISLNDSICANGIKMKNGYKCTYNGSNINNIIGFTGRGDPLCDFRVIIKGESRINGEFSFISEKASTLAAIDYDPIAMIPPNEKYKVELDVLLGRLIARRDDKRLFYFRNTSIDSLDNNQFRKAILDNFEIYIYELSNNHYFVEGVPKDMKNYSFIALIDPAENTITIKYTTIFYKAISIADRIYVYCNVHSIKGAGQVYTIFDLTDGKFQRIFSDRSYIN